MCDGRHPCRERLVQRARTGGGRQKRSLPRQRIAVAAGPGSGGVTPYRIRTYVPAREHRDPPDAELYPPRATRRPAQLGARIRVPRLARLKT